MRWLRLVLGLIALGQSIIQRDVTLGVIGGFLMLTAIANIGCCGSRGCAVNYTNNNKKESEAVYEKLDSKK